jgi:hypothetical protein
MGRTVVARSPLSYHCRGRARRPAPCDLRCGGNPAATATGVTESANYCAAGQNHVAVGSGSQHVTLPL